MRDGLRRFCPQLPMDRRSASARPTVESPFGSAAACEEFIVGSEAISQQQRQGNRRAFAKTRLGLFFVQVGSASDER